MLHACFIRSKIVAFPTTSAHANIVGEPLEDACAASQLVSVYVFQLSRCASMSIASYILVKD